MATIKAIDQDSAHRIHAGQVVLELQQAIKELLENSLDAGATSVEVRIKDHGLDSIEVIDNGSGIKEEDWPSIGLKHHTSKLPALSALPHVTTFGFRGEALSSLCALCESVTLVTATKETAPLGAIIKLGRDGRVLDSSGQVARPRGTTITLTGLFLPLPVRRKEFERTAKREFTKALTTLTAYALVPASVSAEDGRSGVRLKVESSGAGKGGKRNTLLVTDGRGSLRASVIAVWGPKALEGVQDVTLTLDVEVDRLMAKREGLSESVQAVKVSGLISSAAWGQGRSSTDRQFYYINGRPVDVPAIAKAINEVYKGFNTHQAPLAVLDFQISKDSVDINVSPDKRSIFLHSEAQLIEALKTALEAFFAPSRSSYIVEGASHTVKLVQKSLIPSSTMVLDEEDELDLLKEDDDNEPGAETTTDPHGDEDGEDELESLTDDEDADQGARSSRIISTRRSLSKQAESSQAGATSKTRLAVQTLSTASASWSPDRKAPATVVRSSRTGRPDTARTNLRKRLEVYASQAGPSRTTDADSDDASDEVIVQDSASISTFIGNVAEDNLHGTDESEARVVEDDAAGSPSIPNTKAGKGGQDGDSTIMDIDELDSVTEDEMPTPPMRSTSEPAAPDESTSEASSQRLTADRVPRRSRSKAELNGEASQSSQASRSKPLRKASTYRDEIASVTVAGEMTLSFDLTRVTARHRYRRRHQHLEPSSSTKNAYTALAEGGVSSAAGIGNKDMALAEEALARVIRKDDFDRMEVLGQFNRGFIIARLRSNNLSPGDKGKGKEKASSGGVGTDDLFIVDQHASDEKFNFETLQRTTVIKSQSLIRPQPLQLTAGDEIVAMENLDILRSNGFAVKVDDEKLPGRGEKIALTAMPVSKETAFDFKDFEQLLHMLSDGARPAGQMVRPQKARAMFAMRACRKSVMIGKSLTKAQMVQLLRNMGTIDQPWNCPHGRPTMRHLVKLEKGKRATSGRGRIDWSKWQSQT